MQHSSHAIERTDTISNFVSVDEKNRIAAFRPPMVHVLNKNEHSAEGTPYFSLIQARKNVILMGDHIVRVFFVSFGLSRSQGDLGMSKGVTHDVVLNIGFLNEGSKADPALKELYRCGVFFLSLLTPAANLGTLFSWMTPLWTLSSDSWMRFRANRKKKKLRF
jgi:hypothetical protein